MIKKILAVAIVAALSACSSSSDNDPVVDNTGTPNVTEPPPVTETPGVPGVPAIPGTPTPVTPPGGGAGPVTETKAGSYIGSFGGSNGVFVIDNENRLAGLAINADGSALSLFGNMGTADTFTGGLRQYTHQESRPDPTAGVFGSVAGRGANDLAIDVNIVNGQTITSTATSPTAVDLRGTEGSELADLTAESVAGTWSAVHSFCGADITDCQQLTTLMTFNGTSVTGSTQVTDFGPAPIVGAITEFGEAALIEFSWSGIEGYSGVAFFNPANDGTLVFVGELLDEDDTTPTTISALMTRQ